MTNTGLLNHASEFWMIEPEIAFADLKDDMNLARDMVKYVIKDVLEKCPEEMAFFNNFMDKGLIERLQGIVESDFATVTYAKAKHSALSCPLTVSPADLPKKSLE